MTRIQVGEFEALFGADARHQYDATGWRDDWLAALHGITMASDGFLPFTDNVDHAAASGVEIIVEPGGSTRTSDVAASAAKHGITHLQTGLRLFHH